MGRLPDDVLAWMESAGLQLITIADIHGVFAAKVQRLQVRTQNGATWTLIYKSLANGRNREADLYQTWLRQLDEFAPTCHYISHGGLLLTDAGTPLSDLCLQNQPMPIDLPTQLMRAVEKIARLHVATESLAAQWHARQCFHSYPIENVALYATSALHRLQQVLQSLGKSAMARELCRLQSQLPAFYETYPRYLRGRTTLTHGDLHHQNIVVRADEFRFIDWEYAYRTIPQRDFTVFLQNIPEATMRTHLTRHFCDCLERSGWPVDGVSFQHGMAATLIDNTFMMLGFDTETWQRGGLSLNDFVDITSRKFGWIEDALHILS